MTNPYTDNEFIQEGTGDTYIIRTFDADVLEEELVWHRDHHSRTIHVLQGTEWKLQKDDKLPFELVTGNEYFIPKGEYHRIIKGTGNLVIRFRKHINTRL